MGSSLGPFLANIILTEFECIIISDLVSSGTIQFYKQYVDDTPMLIKLSDIPMLLAKFNEFLTNLKFTIDTFPDGVINFLDIKISVDGTDIYRKDMHTGQYIHFWSFEPFPHKTVWIKNRFSITHLKFVAPKSFLTTKYVYIYMHVHIYIHMHVYLYICTYTSTQCLQKLCLTSLLYSSETWTTHHHHIKVLERFHQNCVQQIIWISWESLTPDTVVLERAYTTSIEKRIITNQMHWVGHLVRMEDSRIPKQLSYGELTKNKHPSHSHYWSWSSSLQICMKKGFDWHSEQALMEWCVSW